jgi:hypothetical protein
VFSDLSRGLDAEKNIHKGCCMKFLNIISIIDFWRKKPDLLLGDKTRLTSGGQNQTYFWGIQPDLLLGGQNQAYFWETKPDLLLGYKTRLPSGG